MKLKRRSRATWQGSVADGGGTIALGSGAFEGDYSERARGEEGSPLTNPEELIGAAHAGCFTMSLSSLLTDAGHPPERLETTATVVLEKQREGYAIPLIELVTTGDVPGVDESTFRELADQAKRTCPVSKVLAAAEITLDATLNQGS